MVTLRVPKGLKPPLWVKKSVYPFWWLNKPPFLSQTILPNPFHEGDDFHKKEPIQKEKNL